MLRDYDDALRAAAEIVVGADRDTRAEFPDLTGQEENYTPTFAALLKERLNRQVVDGVIWEVHTYTPKHSEEAIDGTDLIVGLRLKLDGADAVTKGFRVQAKINENRERGLRVVGRARLNKQCRLMMERTQESYVFAYGEQTTKIVRAQNVLAASQISLSRLQTRSVFEFFYGFFKCDWGDFKMAVPPKGDLAAFAREHRARNAMFIVGRSLEEDTGPVDPGPKPKPKPKPRLKPLAEAAHGVRPAPRAKVRI